MVRLVRTFLGMDRRACNRLHVGHLSTGPPRGGSLNGNQAIKKPGLNIGSAGIKTVPGLFSELFNVAASRPAQMTTERPKDSPRAAFRQAIPTVNAGIEGLDRGQPPLRRFEP